MKKNNIYRQPMQESLFEEELSLEALSAMGNPLEQVSALVDFELFRPSLEKALLCEQRKSPAGRKPIDVVSCLRSYSFNVIMVWATTR